MLLETSAIVEYLTNGPRADEIADRIEAAQTRFHIGPTNEFEATAVIASRLRCNVGEAHARVLEFARELGAERMAITPEIGERAVRAFAEFGKGHGHPAQLNFGDCFSYALAKAANVPLLYVGNDFSRKDLA